VGDAPWLRFHIPWDLPLLGYSVPLTPHESTLGGRGRDRQQQLQEMNESISL
jgi:hypothetical protein